MLYMHQQVPVLLLTMIYVSLYSYTKPYRNTYINLLETGLLVDLLFQLMITSNNWFKVCASSTYSVACANPCRVLSLMLGHILK